MNRVEEMTARARSILGKAIFDYQPRAVFGLFSGGHDSLCSTSIAASFLNDFTAAAHINTTIGVKETRLYVRAAAETLGWKLVEKYPPQSYRDICVEHGMPGPGAHLFCYTRLKERCVRELVREQKVDRNDRVILVTGVRVHESKRRMGNVVEVDRRGAQVWVAPCLEWTDEDKEAYIAALNLPRNPVVDEIGMSGECLCGSFAEPGELDIVSEAFPQTRAEIEEIKAACRERGVHAEWGQRPPKVDKHTYPLGLPEPEALPMCHNCQARKAA